MEAVPRAVADVDYPKRVTEFQPRSMMVILLLLGQWGGCQGDCFTSLSIRKGLAWIKNSNLITGLSVAWQCLHLFEEKRFGFRCVWSVETAAITPVIVHKSPRFGFQSFLLMITGQMERKNNTRLNASELEEKSWINTFYVAAHEQIFSDNYNKQKTPKQTGNKRVNNTGCLVDLLKLLLKHL